MIKKISTAKLCVGMYIHDLDASWMDHPFLSSRFPVNNEDIIEKITRAGIRHVYINTAKGLDTDEAVPLAEVQSELEAVKQDIAATNEGLEKEVSFDKEIYRAREVMRDANRAVHSLMENASLGRAIPTDEVEEAVDGIIQSVFRNKDALINLSRIKQIDQYTYLHSISVCVLMTVFSRAVGYEAADIKEVATGALLHDIGKMRVPDEILNKPGKLLDAEFDLMRQHVNYGKEILTDIGGVSEIAMDVTMQHHERIDGTGYPYGLIGDEISQVGKMSAIVDVYDALTSDRCYKRAWEPTYALAKMLEWSKHHFGELLVHQFVRCVGVYPVGTLVRLESGTIGVVVEQSSAGLLSPKIRVIYDELTARYITPEDLDLSVQNENSPRIIEAVSAFDVHVDPQAFL